MNGIVKQRATINGNPVTIEMGAAEVVSPIQAEGDSSQYTINYGNGLMEIGGTVTVSASPASSGMIEGSTVIPLPFSKLLSFQATAVDVIGSGVTGETTFVIETKNGMRVYGSALSKHEKDMSIMWTAKGIM